MSVSIDIIESWANEEGTVNSFEDIMAWLNKLNEDTHVRIDECSINDSSFWFYDDYNGEVLNRKRSFFSIKGMRRYENDEFAYEQPIIIQPEIGYLGIICKYIDGVLNFLMQGKIEPGNVNYVQISPTIQATKSNFTRAHNGELPLYLNMFENSERFVVIYDQIQSEQATRFYKKRNRNMIMIVDEDFEVYPNFKWMTLGQIKKLMDYDNLVNMDTRTVLSGLPVGLSNICSSEKTQAYDLFKDKTLFCSMFDADYQNEISRIYNKINDYKMFQDVKAVQIPLNQLVDWDIDEYGITCKINAPFMVKYYDIEIMGREVQHWTQPLFKALGRATFGLLSMVIDEQRLFLVKITPEIGSFDKVELGPSVQWEATHYLYDDDSVGKVFRKNYENRDGVMVDVVLSEEGGRFFHEENNNVIIEIGQDELESIPLGYAWMSYSSLTHLVQINNCINIQLRNLLSLVKL